MQPASSEDGIEGQSVLPHTRNRLIDLTGEDSLVMVGHLRYNFRISHHKKVGHVVQSILD